MYEAAKFRRFGCDFPRANEPIVVETVRIARAIVHPLELDPVASDRFARLHASFAAARAARGRVVSEDGMARFEPVGLDALVKLRCCMAHWSAGESWDQTGIYDLMMEKITRTGRPQSGCRTIEDVRARYARLDRIFAEVRRDKALRSPRELPRQRGSFRDGIEIHIGAQGEPLFGNRGHHRLAMAKILGLEKIPANLGFVHEAGIAHLAHYRPRSPQTPSAVIRRFARGRSSLSASGSLMPFLDVLVIF